MQFFITATGTDIGKTFILEKTCQNLIARGKKVAAIKPVISGFKADDLDNDSAKIMRIFGLNLTEKNFNGISPYRFAAPLSPNIAAALENKNIDFLELVRFCQNAILKARQSEKYLFIEGAGGIMTPINEQNTFADLISELKIPAILVTGNYLGTISHTLTAIKTMLAYKIQIDHIIFNCKGSQIGAEENLKTLRNFTDIKIING